MHFIHRANERCAAETLQPYTAKTNNINILHWISACITRLFLSPNKNDTKKPGQSVKLRTGLFFATIVFKYLMKPQTREIEKGVLIKQIITKLNK